MRWPPRACSFTRTYVQSPVCGASRMSFYTGRYVQSHGAAWNGIPLRVGEMTLGDHLRPLGMHTALVGKTHMRADVEGMQRLGIDPNSIIGVRVANAASIPTSATTACTGSGPDGRYDPQLPRYNRYLNELGYAGDNPWHDWANAAAGAGDELPPRAGPCATPPQTARAWPKRMQKPLHDPARQRLHARGRRRAVVPAPPAISSHTGPTLPLSLQRDVRRRRYFARSPFARGTRQSTPDLSRVHEPQSQQDFRAR